MHPVACPCLSALSCKTDHAGACEDQVQGWKAVDKKADFISILSIYSSAAGRFSGKEIIPIVDIEEYSYSYFRAMKKNGFESYILFDENGEY